MLICPNCKTKYGKKKRFLRSVFCSECKTKLVYIHTIDDVKVHMLSTPYGNPDLWAKSTLSAEYKLKDLVRVYSAKPGKFKAAGFRKPCPRERFWIHDVFDDNNIPYKIDIVGKYPEKISGGMRKRKFKEFQYIFVRPEDVRAAKKLIKEYETQTDLNPEFFNEGRDSFDFDNMPQTTCPHCGKSCDTDYVLCPFCKQKLYYKNGE